MLKIGRIALLLLLVGGVAHVHVQAQQTRGIVGKPAPAWNISQWYQLENEEQPLKLEDLKGKTVYLYCFQSWCPGCHSRGFPTLKAVREKLKDDENVEFVVVQTVFEGHSTNSFAAGQKVMEKFGLDIPMGHTAGERGSPEMMRNYRTGGTPWTIIIDPKGVVRFNDFHIEADKAVTLIEELNNAKD